MFQTSSQLFLVYYLLCHMSYNKLKYLLQHDYKYNHTKHIPIPTHIPHTFTPYHTLICTHTYTHTHTYLYVHISHTYHILLHTPHTLIWTDTTYLHPKPHTYMCTYHIAYLYTHPIQYTHLYHTHTHTPKIPSVSAWNSEKKDEYIYSSSFSEFHIYYSI